MRIHKNRFMILSALSFFYACTWQKKHISDTDQGKKIPEVAIEKIEKKEIFESLEFAGTLEAAKSQPVYSGVEGIIRELKSKEADKVVKGQKIATIKPSGQGELYQDHHVLAPTSGVITELFVSQGEKIERQGKIVQISDLSSLATTIHASYDDLEHLKKKSHVEVVIGAGSHREFKLEGKVESVAIQASASSLSIPIKVTFDCLDKNDCLAQTHLGMLTKVSLKIDPKLGFLVSGKNLHRGGEEVIVINSDLKVSRIKVKTGKHFGEQVEILEGLTEGMQLVTSYSKEPTEGESVVISTSINAKK